MTTQFFTKLSQNYIEILEDNEYYDVTIEVGEDPNVKIFRAHMIILCHRSPFLRRMLASNKRNNDVLVHIKLPNILPETFQIILRYLYGGIFSSDGQDTSDIFKVLIAADELLLQELVEFLQKFLIENKTDWMEQHFEFTLRTSFQYNNLLLLQQFCTDLMAKSPEKIFKSMDCISLPEKSLISLIRKDDLQMKEAEVWEHVLKWGLAQCQDQTLIPEPEAWTDDDFKIVKNKLQNCLPLIRFFSLSSKEFLHKVRPYKKLFEQQSYESLLNSYMDPDSEPNDNILLPRDIKIDEVIDTTIVNTNIVSIISRWIDKVDINIKFAHLRELYLPYKFNLLLRGSKDGFSPQKFHDMCKYKSNTITFIKVDGTGEILGGYIPSKSNHFSGLSLICSFIFSFKNKNEFKDPILSHIKNTYEELHYSDLDGPSFGSDLKLSVNSNGYGRLSKLKYNEFNHNKCEQSYYEKKIRDTENEFIVQDYEVFQIIKK
ncbi:hypothetical protein RclHR1_01370022 [Rhizophagus clarus]|uniref:BTB domain-containing protein n=1 Tax=Rhizophagus clarus TaxID=94130 RepID=A0A2Z6QAS2_9GLOM|nr:hypothetical protein RclHR1_01370022 [Rhizophagus clarus]